MVISKSYSIMLGINFAMGGVTAASACDKVALISNSEAFTLRILLYNNPNIKRDIGTQAEATILRISDQPNSVNELQLSITESTTDA